MQNSHAENHPSTEMNAQPGNANYPQSEECLRVVIIGNSTTLHGHSPEIGCLHEGGMATSAQDMDYVHLVIAGLERASGQKADVRIRNLADFERNFASYELSQVQDLVDFLPDYLVVALGENIPELTTDEERRAFRDAFKALLGRFIVERRKPNSVICGCFKPNAWKDAMMAHAASDYAMPFVKIDIADDKAMRADGLSQNDGVQNHPGDKGMAAIASRILEGFFPTVSGYAVCVNGAEVPVRPIRISAMPFNQWAPGYQRPVDQTEIAGMVCIQSNGPAAFAVKSDRAFTKAKLRPAHAAIPVERIGNELRFTLPKPGYYVLELDGYHRPLEIFVEPERDFAQERKEANIVFGPGIHQPVVVKLKSHDRVYIDKDAVVLGSFQVDNATDVKVSGYGIICGSRNHRKGDNCYRYGMDIAIRIIDSHNIVFDGPVVLDSSCWCVAAYNSSDIELAHLKVTAAWRYNTDGIDICNSQRVHVHDCFVHSFDDTIVLKGNFPEFDRKDPVEDILVERCVCWCGWGRTLEIGLETFAPYYRNIVFRDCVLIHNNCAALSVHLGGPSVIEDITYSHIDIEVDASEMASILQSSRDQKVTCKASYAGAWLSVTNTKMFGPGSIYQKLLGYDPVNDPFGTFRHLTVEHIDIMVDDGAATPYKCIHPQDGSSFGTIDIRDVRLNGAHIE